MLVSGISFLEQFGASKLLIVHTLDEGNVLEPTRAVADDPVAFARSSPVFRRLT